MQGFLDLITNNLRETLEGIRKHLESYISCGPVVCAATSRYHIPKIDCH